MRKNMVIAVLLLLGSLNASTIAPAVVRARPGAARLRGAPGCPIFPASNVWNQDISGLPVAADSARLIGAIGLHHLNQTTGADLEVVDTSNLVNGP